MFVFGLSEPGRGSDAANPEVTATRVAGGWRLQGEKCWSTNARWASHVIVHAMTRPQNPPGHRSTCFIVPMDDPNLPYHEMGGKEVWLQSSTGAIALDGVEVPDSAMLGEEDEGFRVMVTTLNGGRLFIASLALASLAFALDACRTYAQERRQFADQPIGRFQRVQDVLLDMDVALEQGPHLADALRGPIRDWQTEPRIRRQGQDRVLAARLRTAAAGHGNLLAVFACLDEFGLIRHQRRPVRVPRRRRQ